MAKKNLKYLKIIFALLFFCLYFVSKSESKEVEVVFFKEKGELFQRWDKLFAEHELINFVFQNQVLSGFGLIGINSKGDYFLYSRIAEKIMQFDNKGNFKRLIGARGQGPGEYQLIGNSFFDREDNLYVYDISTRTISIFAYPGYQYVKQIRIKSSVNKIFINREGNFITFSLYNVPNLLKKHDNNGDILIETFKCEDETLRIAMARFNPGGLGDIPNKGFLFIYPDKYYIYLYDYNLILKKIYKPRHFSKFYPRAQSFPKDLAPNEFSYEHSKWWDKFLHPGDIYFLKDKLFLVVLVETEGRFGRFYINLHDLDGITYARGLEIPYEGRIVYAQGDYVYIMEDEKFVGGDEFVPTRLHRYKLSL